MEILKKSLFKHMEIEKTLQTQVGEILEEIRFNKDIGVKKYNLLFYLWFQLRAFWYKINYNLH